MGIEPAIMFGHVMHKRLFPKVNAFTYGMFYVVLPLSKLENMPLRLNCFGLLSFFEKDHGNRDGTNLEEWARSILKHYNMDKADGEIVLVTLPRVLGYVFNPVSFWLCYDQEGMLRVVLCEVNNTFGETHTYLCAHPDQKVITDDTFLRGEKVFHVSPFLPRDGYYKFRFKMAEGKCGFWVNYHAANGDQQLLTALTGTTSPLSKKNLMRAFFFYPLVTFKAVYLIHWQALKIVCKKIKYISKPLQKERKITAMDNIKNL